MADYDARTYWELRDTRNVTRVAKAARDSLRKDPRDGVARYLLALALLGLERPHKAKPHIDRLLESGASSPSYHVLAAAYYLRRQNLWYLRDHVSKGLLLAPQNVDLHYYAALADFYEGNWREAHERIEWAYRQEPERLYLFTLLTEIKGAYAASTNEVLERIHEHELLLDYHPANAELHRSLGDLFLKKLGDPRNAQHHFGAAYRLDPRCRFFRHRFLDAIAEKNLFYRLLSIPSRSIRSLLDALQGVQLAPGLGTTYLLLSINGIGPAWLATMTVILGPAGWYYDRLLLQEARREPGHAGKNERPTLGLPLKLGAFLAVNLLAFAALFLVLEIPADQGFFALGLIILAHFAYLLVMLPFRRRSRPS